MHTQRDTETHNGRSSFATGRVLPHVLIKISVTILWCRGVWQRCHCNGVSPSLVCLSSRLRDRFASEDSAESDTDHRKFPCENDEMRRRGREGVCVYMCEGERGGWESADSEGWSLGKDSCVADSPWHLRAMINAAVIGRRLARNEPIVLNALNSLMRRGRPQI